MEIKQQFNAYIKYKRANLSSIENNQTTNHSQAIYTSRLLNPYTTIQQVSLRLIGMKVIRYYTLLNI